MNIVRKNRTKTINNSEHCIATEYPLDDKDINGAIVRLTGRYPDSGRVVNLKCKELVYVVKGSGTVVIGSKEIALTDGDLILIDPLEHYYWDGQLVLFISCTPAWYPEQHKKVG